MSNLVQGKESIEGILRGVTLAADAVRGTIGAAGKNVIIEQELQPFHIITNDGSTIIENLVAEDVTEKRGLGFVKELVDRSNNTGGDGSTTTTLLLEAILLEAQKYESKGMELKNSLEELIPVIEQKIDEQKRMITDVKEVATISSESEVIGNLLSEIYGKIGKEGIIRPQYVLGMKGNSYTITEGIRFDGTGYLAPAMVYDEEARKENRKENVAIYKNPTILVTKKKISHINDINPLLMRLSGEGKKDLVIFANDMDSGVASMMIEAHKKKTYNLLVIKAPVLWNNYVFEDFAKCVGATIVEDSEGITFKNIKLTDLGTCGEIVVDKETTIITGGKDISDHLKTLAESGQNDDLLRLSWLTTKTCLLKIGADNHTTLSYLRLKLDDAVNSSRTALIDGVVSGGGIALLNCSKELVGDSIGTKILKEALKEPLKQIVRNAGYSISETGNNPKGTICIDGNFYNGNGLDAKKGIFVNMFEAGIIDSAKVVKASARNAISLAASILSTCGNIYKPKKTPEEIAYDMVHNKIGF